jgi:hypothetical protein
MGLEQLLAQHWTLELWMEVLIPGRGQDLLPAGARGGENPESEPLPGAPQYEGQRVLVSYNPFFPLELNDTVRVQFLIC